MKKLLYVFGGVLVLLVIIFFAVALSLGSIIKSGVNKVGPQVTQTSVELGSAQVSPFSGHGTLSNLVVGNPPGWQSAHAFSLGQISMDVEPRSLMGDHVVINSIVIDQPDIIYETRLTSSNLQDLLKNIQASTGGEKEPKTKDGKPMKIEVKSFRLQNAKLTAIAAGNSATVEMPAVVLENLGTQEGGLTPQQLAVAVVKEVTAQAVQAGASAALESGALEKGLRKILGGDKKP
jgi:hypothetical protein